MCILKRLAIGIIFISTSFAQAQVVPGPPPPAKYAVTVRYNIQTLRDTHVAQYDALVEHLKKLKFEFDPRLEDLPPTDPEDRTKNTMNGDVPSANALKILENPDVASILLVPAKFALPVDPAQQVQVRLQLNSGLSAEQQFQLHEQVLLQLGLLGFREAPGYDHRGYRQIPYTRIVGVLPMSSLKLLLRDLRLMPLNWFDVAVNVKDLPAPLRNSNPILVTEVLPDSTPLPELPPVVARNPAFLEKISPDLWDLVVAREPGVFRVQLIVVGTPSIKDADELRFSIRQAAPSFIMEGSLSPVITGSLGLEDVPRLAEIPEVTTIRLARYRDVSVDPKIPAKGDKQRALELSGLTELHQRGFRGKGVHLAIIDTDFRGWDRLVAEKKLPKNARHIDLSSLPDDPVQSTPVRGDPGEIGHGSHCALAANLAAPEAELVLVRVSGVDPYQVAEAVKYFRGDYFSDAVSRRRDALLLRSTLLKQRREKLLDERPDIIKGFEDDRELEINYGFLGPVWGWLFSERQLHFQHMEYQRKLEKELGEQFDRFLAYTDSLEKLKGITLVASALNWPDGYPVGGASTISRLLHIQERPRFLWFQAVGNTRGQAWTGMFRDADKNGFMEFADLKTPLRKGRWTHELNFLGWQPFGGALAADLPAQARVRLSLQWREPHDPDYYFKRGDEDYYLRPLATLQLHVLKQRDPSLKIMPADSFERAARSRLLPVRLLHLPTYTIYEHSVEFTVDKQPASYAIQIERLLPSRWIMLEDPLGASPPRFLQLKNLVPLTTRPLGVPTLPGIEKNWELHLRLYAQVLDDNSRPLGRPMWLDYATEEGSMGLPADSLGVFTVGAVRQDGRPFQESALGPPAFQGLGGTQPDLWAYADLGLLPEGSNPAYGSSLATMFGAGLAASMLSKCSSPDQVAEALRKQACKIVHVPSH